VGGASEYEIDVNRTKVGTAWTVPGGLNVNNSGLLARECFPRFR
jgi:hypothetical protein